MPCFYTHYRFGQEVLKNIDLTDQKIIKKEPIYYEIFNQSFDNLYYHHTGHLKRDIIIWHLSNFAHKHNVNDYFKNMIQYILDNNLQNNPEIIGYLYGSINHYVLDSTFHPYVYYKTGVFKRNNVFSYKYEGQHAKLEYMLDAYYYEKDTGLKIFKYKLYQDRLPKVKFSLELIDCINNTFLRTFNTENVGYSFQKSYLQERNIYKKLFYDKYGFKKFFYHFFDFITPLKGTKIKYFSYHIKNIDDSILNEAKNDWYNPCEEDKKYNYSVEELYNMALEKSVYNLNNLHLVLLKKYPLKKFLKELGNNSYSTGLDCNKNVAMKKFER